MKTKKPKQDTVSAVKGDLPFVPPWENELEEKVLVACPTYAGKKYALESYIQSYNDFIWPQKGLYMVDNTGDSLKYFEHLKSLKVDCAHISPQLDWQKTFVASWKKIARKAIDGGYRWVASIEADVICPPLTLDTLMNVAHYTKALHVAHSYSWHKDQTPCAGAKLIGLGCNLISTEILYHLFFKAPEGGGKIKWITDAMESELYEYPKVVLGVPVIEMHNVLDIRHLDGKGEYYVFDRETIPEFTPGRTTEGKPLAYKNLTMVLQQSGEKKPPAKKPPAKLTKKAPAGKVRKKAV